MAHIRSRKAREKVCRRPPQTNEGDVRGSYQVATARKAAGPPVKDKGLTMVCSKLEGLL